jgi:hypothetical protein
MTLELPGERSGASGRVTERGLPYNPLLIEAGLARDRVMAADAPRALRYHME